MCVCGVPLQDYVGVVGGSGSLMGWRGLLRGARGPRKNSRVVVNDFKREGGDPGVICD